MPEANNLPSSSSRPEPEQTNTPVVSRNSAPTTTVPRDCPVTAMETADQDNTTAPATPDNDTQQSMMAMMHLILKQIQDQILQQQQFQERFMQKLEQIQEHLSKLSDTQQQKTSVEQPNNANKLVLSKLFCN
ncbi:MAG: hypothetical protein AAGJ80_09395 [Cyanobacteria bacterium J06553_1]